MRIHIEDGARSKSAQKIFEDCWKKYSDGRVPVLSNSDILKHKEAEVYIVTGLRSATFGGGAGGTGYLVAKAGEKVLGTISLNAPDRRRLGDILQL